MAATFAFVGMLLTSLVVGLLAALQLADFFQAGEEFLLIVLVIAIFACAAMLAFVITAAAARRISTLNLVAFWLVVLALVLVSVPNVSEWIATRTGAPLYKQDLQIVLEILVPAALIVLVQWGLVRRRWLQAAGDEDLTLWPWITTVVAGLAILNPLGLAILASALKRDPADWLWQVWTMVAAIGAAVVVVAAAIECYIRGRMLRRRLRAPLLRA
jgi:hypothetical protein